MNLTYLILSGVLEFLLNYPFHLQQRLLSDLLVVISICGANHILQNINLLQFPSLHL